MTFHLYITFFFFVDSFSFFLTFFPSLNESVEGALHASRYFGETHTVITATDLTRMR